MLFTGDKIIYILDMIPKSSAPTAHITYIDAKTLIFYMSKVCIDELLISFLILCNNLKYSLICMHNKL